MAMPKPTEVPEFFADELIREIRAREGRVYRFREVGVFAITQNPETARWLELLGARPYMPAHATPTWESPAGSYKRAHDGPTEWDFWIHIIPVLGEETVWQAAGRERVPTVEVGEFR